MPAEQQAVNVKKKGGIDRKRDKVSRRYPLLAVEEHVPLLLHPHIRIIGEPGERQRILQSVFHAAKEQLGIIGANHPPKEGRSTGTLSSQGSTGPLGNLGLLVGSSLMHPLLLPVRPHLLNKLTQSLLSVPDYHG